MADETIETIRIADDEEGQRLDRVLTARIPALSRSRLKALILDGRVAIAARTICDPASHVKLGDTVTVKLMEAAPVTGGLRFELADFSPAPLRPGRGGPRPSRGKPKSGKPKGRFKAKKR